MSIFKKSVEQPKKKGIGIIRMIKRIFWLTVLGAMIIVYYFLPKGTGTFLGDLLRTGSKAVVNTPVDQVQSEFQTVQMKFQEERAEIDGFPCPKLSDLPSVITTLKQKYPNKKIIVVYYENPDDAYIVVNKFEKWLESNSIQFIREKQ